MPTIFIDLFDLLSFKSACTLSLKVGLPIISKHYKLYSIFIVTNIMHFKLEVFLLSKNILNCTQTRTTHTHTHTHTHTRTHTHTHTHTHTRTHTRTHTIHKTCVSQSSLFANPSIKLVEREVVSTNFQLDFRVLSST